MKEQAKKIFNSAIGNLQQANTQLFKPKEDVVSYVVCKNAQFAIENYLKGFLLSNNIDPKNISTIDVLFEECKKINPKFEKIDLSDFECKSHKIDSGYCNDVAKVSNCFDIADSIDTLLRQENVI